jgi:hypothetical protein
VATSASIISKPPVTRLYRHALESIFSFCKLRDLGSLMAVSCDWQSAVLSMSPIRCVENKSDSTWPLECASSRLSRHVIGLTCRPNVWVSLDASRLRLLAARMPQLELLDCLVEGPLTESMTSDFARWTRMKSLSVWTNGEESDDEEDELEEVDEGDDEEEEDERRVNAFSSGINLLLAAIAEHMPLLHSLTLWLPPMQLKDDPPVNFRPLAGSASSNATVAEGTAAASASPSTAPPNALRRFTLGYSDPPHFLSTAQLADLRALLAG